MPSMRHANHKGPLLQFNNPVSFCFKKFLGTKRQGDASKIYQEAQSSQKPGLERVPTHINSSPSIFSPETVCDSPKDKGLQRETQWPWTTKYSEVQLSTPCTFRFSMLNAPANIQFVFPTSAKSATQSSFMWVPLGLLVQLLNMKLHFAHTL